MISDKTLITVPWDHNFPRGNTVSLTLQHDINVMVILYVITVYSADYYSGLLSSFIITRPYAHLFPFINFEQTANCNIDIDIYIY
jgi:hypothetical protein